MSKTKVFLVQQAGLGREGADPLYTIWITSVRRNVKERSVDVVHVHSGTEVIDSVADREHEVSLVFFAKGMFQRAQRLKRKHPGLNVVLLTATPEGLSEVAQGVKVFPKSNLDDYDWNPLVEAILT